MKGTRTLTAALLAGLLIVGPLAGTVGATLTETQTVTFSQTSTVRGIGQVGDYYYVTQQDQIQVYKWNGTAMNLVSEMATQNSYSRGVEAAGDRLIVLNESSGRLEVYDISTRSNPVNIGSVPKSGPFDLGDSGNFVYVGNGQNVEIYDISTQDPALANTVSMTADTAGLDVENGRMVVTNHNELKYYNVTGSTVDLLYQSTEDVGYGAVLSKDGQYIATTSDSLEGSRTGTYILNVTEPNSVTWTQIGSLSTDPVFWIGHTVYATDGSDATERWKIEDGVVTQLQDLGSKEYQKLITVDGGYGMAPTYSTTYHVYKELSVSVTGPARRTSNSTGAYTATYNGQDVTENATWSVNNTAIATVIGAGSVKFNGTGTVAVTATYQGTTDTFTTTVKDLSVTLTNLGPGGNTYTFTQDGQMPQPTWVNEAVGYTVLWGSENVTTAAGIGTPQNVTETNLRLVPTESGNYTATFAYEGGNVDVGIVAQKAALAANYTSVPPYTVYSDYQGEVFRAVLHSEGRSWSLVTGYTVGSSNTSVLVYNESLQNPIVAKAAGTATLTMDYEDLATNVTTWTVKPVNLDLAVEDQKIKHAEGTVDDGDVFNYTVTKTNESGTFNVTGEANVTSSNTSIVTVSQVLGQYWGTGYGQATLTATYGGVSDSVTVTVDAKLRWADYSALPPAKVPLLPFTDWGFLTIFAGTAIAVVVGVGTKSTILAQGSFMIPLLAGWLVGLVPVYVALTGLILTGVAGYAYQTYNIGLSEPR